MEGKGVDILQVGKQKREFYRARISWPVTLETAQGIIDAETKDLSSEGANIHSSRPLSVDEPVRMTIRPPGKEPLQATAMVMWSSSPGKSGEPVVIGVRFIDISAEDRRFLVDQISQHLKSKIDK
jgi:hypothetical protein